jgi:hypothetical protein
VQNIASNHPDKLSNEAGIFQHNRKHTENIMYISQQALQVLHQDRVDWLQKMAQSDGDNQLLDFGKRVVRNIGVLLSEDNTLDEQMLARKSHRTTQELAAVRE